MGFSSWNHFGGANCTRNVCDVVNLTEIADAMRASGLRDAGYEYVNLVRELQLRSPGPAGVDATRDGFIARPCQDDGWVSGRQPNGTIIPDSKVFPNGVKAVADCAPPRPPLPLWPTPPAPHRRVLSVLLPLAEHSRQ